MRNKVKMSLHKLLVQAGLMDMYDLYAIGIEPESISGYFSPKNLHVVHTACEKFPDLRIISESFPYIFNRFVPNSKMYYLGNHDPNPDLETEVQPLSPGLFQRIFDQHSSIPVEKRDGLDRFAIAWSSAVLNGAGPLCTSSLESFAFKMIDDGR